MDTDGASWAALTEIAPLTEAPESLPVLAVTAERGADYLHKLVSRGVRDFVATPIDDSELLIRVRNTLQARRLHHQLTDRSAILDEAVRGRERELDTTRESLSMLAAIADYHDDDTYQHSQRVGIGAALIAEALSCRNRSWP